MPRKPALPKYRHRVIRGRDVAVVRLRDATSGKCRDYWLGEYGSDESQSRYARLLAEWQAAGRHLPGPRDDGDRFTVTQLIHAYWTDISRLYGASDLAVIGAALRVVRRICGDIQADDFGPARLRQVRQAMIDGDPGDPTATPPIPARKPWRRQSINRQLHRVRAMIRWAASHEMLSGSQYEALKTVEPLRAGRTTAPESQKIMAVASDRVDAVLPHVPSVVADMIRIQTMTGMRPGEVCAMRAEHIDRSDKACWIWQPEHHKTAHHGHTRRVFLGPPVIALLRPYVLRRPTDQPLFSPAESEGGRRRLPAEDAKRAPGDGYEVGSYRRAIWRACDLVWPLPAKLAPRKLRNGKREPATRWKARMRKRPAAWAAVLAWRREHRWNPNQLRHAYATEVAATHGLEAAALLMGHASAKITDAVYAERDYRRAREIALKSLETRGPA